MKAPVALLAILLFGCGGGGTPDLSDAFDMSGALDMSMWADGAGPGLDGSADIGDDLAFEHGVSIYQVSPAILEPDVTSWVADHYAFRDPSATQTGKLLLFLPGTSFAPDDYQRLLTVAAQQGYLVVGLSYANNEDVGAISDSNDPDCTLQSRLEILTGEDLSPKVSVGVADSVIGRLVGLLAYLDAMHPGEGWGAFVSGGQPAWASIVAAGHSLGGGEAALIGLQHAVARVVTFSAPNDHQCGDAGGGATKPAAWELAGTTTPPALWFGLAHLWDSDDEALELLAWSSLGMDPFGTPASVNIEKVTTPPYDGAHELKTDALPAGCASQAACTTMDAHRSTAVDANTPLDNGVPHFLTAWRYMLGP